MKSFVGFILAVFSVFFLTSCGGGGGGSQQNAIVFTQTLAIDQSGGMIEDGTRGIKLVVPPSALTQQTEVTLEVRQTQRTGVTPDGWSSNENAVDVTVDPSALSVDGKIAVFIPHAALEPDERALFLSTDDKGTVIPVETEYDATGFRGEVTKALLEEAGRSRSRGVGRSVGLFLEVTSIVLSQPSGSLWVYDGGTLRQPTAGETMDQECTAVLVHGIADGRQKLLPLAQFLSRSDIAPGDQPAYDEVWVYEYNWLAGIAGSGADLADDVRAVVGSGKVDLWGHSMGGLVSRWAIEKEQLGDDVHRLYTLGTPHEGFPFERVAYFIAYLLDVPLTQGLEDLLSNSDFLDDLNVSASPYSGTTKYFTLCGDQWYGIFSPIGLLYSWFGIANDSVVPVFSAQSFVLQDKSQYWANNVTATATIGLNHSDLRSAGNAVSPLVQIVVTDDARGWLEACEHDHEWTVINLHPAGAIWSQGWNVGGGQQVGDVLLAGLRRASFWSSSAETWVDLNPLSASESLAHDVSDGKQAGWAVVGGQAHASLWSGSGSSWVDLNPAGAQHSIAWAVDGGQQAGYAQFDGIARAALWSGTASSWVNLNPMGGVQSSASDVHDGQQVGGVDFGGGGHAGFWTGSAASWVDIHPAGAISSYAYGVHGGQQVGIASFALNVRHASLWTGSASSWVDLHPPGASESTARDADGVTQVGWSTFNGFDRASLWHGNAGSWVDLHSYLPAVYSASYAFGIDRNGGVSYVMGSAWNSATKNFEAVMWVSSNGVGVGEMMKKAGFSPTRSKSAAPTSRPSALPHRLAHLHTLVD